MGAAAPAAHRPWGSPGAPVPRLWAGSAAVETGSTAPGGRSGQPTTGLPSGAFPGQSSQSNQSITPGSGIAGVVSKSSGTSIMIYLGQQTYSGWQFMYTERASKDGADSRSAARVSLAPVRGHNPASLVAEAAPMAAVAPPADPRARAALATDAAEAANCRRHRRLAGSDVDGAAGCSHTQKLTWSQNFELGEKAHLSRCQRSKFNWISAQV